MRPRTRNFYRRTLELLSEAQVPFLVGGGYAFTWYTGIARPPKDFDLFLRRPDCERALAILAAAGYHTELRFAHRLAKAQSADDVVDLIFSSGNGIAQVDDEWFAHARRGVVLGVPVQLCPPEETIWSKAFVMERERYDGADIAHLFLACGETLDWPRLLRRFDAHWRVLLSHLVLFGFSYPDRRRVVPPWVIATFVERLVSEHGPTANPSTFEDALCRGTLISREQYLVDVERWGYREARLAPAGPLSPQEIERWTSDIGKRET
jgi:hypothetical protein